jgi:hypothetical protein
VCGCLGGHGGWQYLGLYNFSGLSDEIFECGNFGQVDEMRWRLFHWGGLEIWFVEENNGGYEFKNTVS